MIKLEQVKDRVSEIKVVDTYRFAVIARCKSKTDKKDAAMLARFLKLGFLPEVPIPTEQVEQPGHLFEARESMVRMLTQLKNMPHAALVRSGYAKGRAAFQWKRTRSKLLSLEELSAVDRQVLEMSLRQMSQVESEISQLEAEIIERGKSLAGLKRVLQIDGLKLLAAIGLLAEVGSIELFDTSKQLVA
jgi:transposase